MGAADQHQAAARRGGQRTLGTPAGRADHPAGRGGPGARRAGRGCRGAVGRSAASSPSWRAVDSSVGIAAGPALYFALAMVATAVMFLAVGALTSQLAATRRQAACLCGLVPRRGLRRADDRRRRRRPARADLGVAARLGRGAPAADRAAAAGLAPGRRASPRCWPRLPWTWPAAATSGRHRAGPGEPPAAAAAADRARRAWRSGLSGRRSSSWWVAIAVSRLAVRAHRQVGRRHDLRDHRYSRCSPSSAPGEPARARCSASCFLLLAVLVAFAAAGQVTAARSEESGGRLDQLLARPVSRARWLGGRLLVAVVGAAGQRRPGRGSSPGWARPASTPGSASARCWRRV